jgi:MFS family permease
MVQDGGMSVIRGVAQTVVTTVRAARVATVGTTRAGRFLGRNLLRVRERGAGGESGMLRLLDLHAASCAGDTLVALGLAGTIFFSVPAGEARGHVALYLFITMLPFALLAPVVGPVLDRFRHGRRYALAVTMLGRAFLAFLLSEHLTGWALYPAAFGMLVLSRAYGVARSAAVPRLLPAGLGLSEAGARASVFGTFAGAIVLPIGLLAGRFGAQWPLRVSILIFLWGMVTALRLPPRADSDPPETMPRILQPLARRGVKVLSGRVIVAALLGSATLRALFGFLTLYLAFAIKGGTLPVKLAAWQLSEQVAVVVVAGALGVGSFLATAIGTRLRIHRPALLQAIGIVLTAFVAVLAADRNSLGTVALLCLVTAIASGLAKLAVDASIQERVDEQVRASAFAHSETLLMVAWVLGGAVGLIPFGGSWGLLIAATFMTLGAVRALYSAVVLRKERLRGAPPPAS